jgi:putative hydrolase of the HAD superfamily
MQADITMIKAVFFDLYHTLIGYDPPREQSLAKILSRLGVIVPVKALKRPMVTADEYFYRETTQKALKDRNREETFALWVGYYTVVLKEADITPAPEVIQGILNEMQKTRYEMALFDDVLPALKALSEKDLLLGLISNVDKDISPMLEKLGILPFLKYRMTSQEAGVAKPHPDIFHKGVERAGITPQEALYVGDQWVVDVQASRKAGMRSLLIDRGDFFDEVSDTDKISSLKEIAERIPTL